MCNINLTCIFLDFLLPLINEQKKIFYIQFHKKISKLQTTIKTCLLCYKYELNG